MLLIFSGLPGVGKTTIARLLAQKLHAIYIRIDTIEQAIKINDPSIKEIGPAGYFVAYGIAEDNLRLGNIVIADSVNSLVVTRDAWHLVAKKTLSRAIDIEVICSDPDKHRHRVETRESDITGLKLPTWQDVQNRDYESWQSDRIVIDTAHKTTDENIAELLMNLGLAYSVTNKKGKEMYENSN